MEEIRERMIEGEEDEGWVEPIIEERFDPDRTVLSLSFLKKATEKNDRKNTVTI